MEISEQQTLPSFEDESQFYRQVSHASQRVLPGSEEAQQMTVGSGKQLSMLLNVSSPIGRFSKILLESCLWTTSQEYCYVWNRLDTRFALSAFQLTPLGLSTDDNGSSLWRTPNATDVTGGGQDGQKRLDAGHAMQLSDQIMNQKLWPTPTVPNGGRRNPEGTSITGKKPDGGKAQMDLREIAIRTLRESGLAIGSGSLNPRFVEELMGFEIDHTALKHWETPSSPSKRTRSSRRSRKLWEFAFTDL
jgi:hypothetical protein